MALIVLGPVIYFVGLILTRYLDESEGGLSMLFFIALGSIILVTGLTLTVAKLISDKLNKK